MYNALIIGLGKAGKRFYKVIDYIEKNEKTIKLVGIVENDKSKLAGLYNKTTEIFNDCESAFSKFGHNIDLIFICTNEYAHIEQFRLIKKKNLRYKRIITEKPLAKTLDEAKWINDNFNSNDITLNFVERYSPICNTFKRWIKDNELEPVRVNFFWGKYRIFDPRSTIGTFSEISHPLDLVTYLCDIKAFTEYNIISQVTSKSDFCPRENQLTDSITVNISFKDRFLVTGHSSFIWDERNRKILIYLQDKNKRNLYLAKLVFDNPTWDLDKIYIYDLRKTQGKPELILKEEYSEQDVNEELFKVSKIYKFIKENLVDLGLEVNRPVSELNLAYCDQALYVQNMLEDIKCKDWIESSAITTIFSEIGYESKLEEQII